MNLFGFLPSPLPTGLLAPGFWVLQDGFVNLYVVRGSEGLLCVDAGWRPSRVIQAFTALGLDVRDVATVMLTHRHWDHARGVRAFPDASVFPEKTGTRCDIGWEDGSLDVGNMKVRALACPGHTEDSMAYVVSDRWMFTGDTVWLRDGRASPNPAWFNRDNKALRDSLHRLATLDGVEGIFTAHSGATWDVARAMEPWQDGELHP